MMYELLLNRTFAMVEFDLKRDLHLKFLHIVMRKTNAHLRLQCLRNSAA